MAVAFFWHNLACKQNADSNNSAFLTGKSERSSVVELNLAKVDVESSNLFARSILNLHPIGCRFFFDGSKIAIQRLFNDCIPSFGAPVAQLDRAQDS
jgi:hypothetical protein